jgi:hypothetical protein
MLAVPPHEAWHYHETSGTTGEPISSWCGLNELRAMAAVVHRMVPELAQDTILLKPLPALRTGLVRLRGGRCDSPVPATSQPER